MPIKSLKKKQDKINKKIIILGDDDDNPKEYLCQYCNVIIRGIFSEDSIWCNHCHSYTPIKDSQKVMNTLKADTMDNIEPAIVSIDYNMTDRVKIRKEPILKGGALALSKKGNIRFTSYYDSSADKEDDYE